MIILHAADLDSEFFIWGEVPAGLETDAPKRRRQKGVTTRNQFPYDAGADRLSAALAAAGLASRGGKSISQTLYLWVPTADGRPLASSPLIADQPPSETAVDLAAWSVSAFQLSTANLIDLLIACVGKEMLAPGVVVGKDLAFWTTAMRFGGALVARQQYLPGIARKGKRYFACWEPIFSGSDSEQIPRLARVMPASARALARDGIAPPDVPTASLVEGFVGAVVDHLVRSCASAPPFAAAAKGGRKRKRSDFDSLHDQWLHALRSPDASMSGEETQLEQLRVQVAEWRRPISLATAIPFRLCFRLEEPQNIEDKAGRIPAAPRDWYVRYLLQAADDPSLLIEARDAWKARGPKVSVLRRDDFQAREFLLSSLGQASGICPRIEASLKSSAPDGYALDAAGAHEFLTERAWALQQSGFVTLLPAWWTRKGTKLRLSARAHVKSPQMQPGSGISLDSIVQFDWRVALGDDSLTLEELELLAKLKAPLVQVRGQWVELNAGEIQAALEFWKKRGSGEATVREIVRMALGSARTPGGLAFEGVEASGWIGDFLKRLEGSAAFEEIEPPAGFQGTLRPYQSRGYSWLSFLRQWGLGACLADDMGLGKTIQALALIQRDWESNGRRPVLLICPTSVTGNWQKEAARFAPTLPVMVHHGIKRERGAPFAREAERQAMVISSYSLLHRDFEILKTVSWSGVILDEAQNIKNPETKQARAARLLPADYRIALTGTPVENNIGDLWSIMEFLIPGFLGTQTEFKRSFFLPIQAYRDTEATQRLKRLTGPFILRRLKTDKAIISDLPEKMEMKVFCNLTREQASLYEAVVRESTRDLETAQGIQRKGLVLATLSKLKQVCNHPAQFLGDNSAIPGRSGKLARLTEMLEEVLEVGDCALVFSQFAEMGGIMKRHLQETFGREVLFLHGSVARKQRDCMVEQFQSSGGPAIFVLSLKAGGTGLNLTRANHVFHYDRWWNPAVENQASDRAFRIGQTRNVQVHKFLCGGTLEERIDEMIENKKEIAANVVGAGEGWLTELSTAELKDLFALRQDAVGE